jgi:gliding motility-associated-like protein
MNKLFTTTLFLLLLCGSAFAQIVPTTNTNGNQLAQILGGNGVTITNVVMNCPNGAAGTFNATNTNLGMANGILLTTGSDTMVTGPNNTSQEGWDNLAPGDVSLDAIAGAGTHDACALEFDMNILSDSVEFRYIFGSEEYPEWVNSGYNDAFAFFISGPGIVGQQNLAVVPGTSSPLTIDNVNSTSNSQYYRANGTGFTAPYNGSNTYIQYDGFTTVLTAKKKGLQPCQTYHLKLVIADGGDGVYDSGVFLEANSLTSNAVTMDTAATSVPNVTNAVEGCVHGVIRFRLEKSVPYPTVVQYQIGGTAVNGTDYTTIPNSITIAAGDTMASLLIYPITDNLVEGTESVIIRLASVCSNVSYDSSTLYIIDSLGINAGADQNICAGDQAQLNATGSSSYVWNNAASLSNANIANPIATPTTTTTYRVTSNVGLCVAEDLVRVYVVPASFTVNAGQDVSSCSTPNVQLNAVVTGSPVAGNPFTYTWTPASSLSAANISNPVATPSATTSYVIEVASGNCKAKDTVTVSVGGLNVSTASTNETCYGYNNGTANVTANGTAPYTYVWSNNGSTASISNLAGGNYSVVVTDNTGCSASASVTVASTNPIHFSTPAITNIKCFGDANGSASITAAGGAGSLTYAWSNGSTTTIAANLSASTAYTVSATDANGCVADTTLTLASPAQINANITATNVTCNAGGTGNNITPNAGQNGTASASATGGVAPYTFVWNTSDVTAAISNLTAGSYNVVVTDANNCSTSAATVLSEPQPMNITASSMAPLCANSANGTINANSNGGTGSYMFSVSMNGAAVQTNTTGAFTDLAAGDYVISVSDANNCVKTANLNLPQPVADEVSIATVATSCFDSNDGKIIITPVSILNQPYLYSLDAGGNQQLNEFYNVSGGMHRLHIINNSGCTLDTAVMVAQPAQAVLAITPGDTTIEMGGSIQLTTSLSAFNTDSAVSYAWSPNAGLTCVDCANPTVNSYEMYNEYAVTVTYNGKCSVVASAKINAVGHQEPFVPNAFTPNGDGNNDVFMVFGEGIGSVELNVFNRWGEKVYESNNQFDGWNGTYKGELQNTGVFVYTVTATYLDGKKMDKTGTVTLVR